MKKKPTRSRTRSKPDPLPPQAEQMIGATVKAIINSINTPMNLRPFGGTHEGLLLGVPQLDAISKAVRKILVADYHKNGMPQKAYSGDHYPDLPQPLDESVKPLHLTTVPRPSDRH